MLRDEINTNRKNVLHEFRLETELFNVLFPVQAQSAAINSSEIGVDSGVNVRAHILAEADANRIANEHAKQECA